MWKACVVMIALASGAATSWAAERAWQVRGELVGIKSGSPEVVVLRLADGRTIEVPLESLTAESQAAARNAAPPAADGAGGDDAAMTVRGPFGRPVRLTVPDVIKDVETDAIHCRTAAEAADVYRLLLAGDRIAKQQRTAAEARLGEWAAMADRDVVRLGDRWVPRAEARAAAEAADGSVAHTLELLRLGSPDLAGEELRKATRLDPERGRAQFLAGLGYALVEKNYTRAADEFAAVVQREPDNAAALNNLAVLEVLARRYGAVAGHFLAALDYATEPQVVGQNLALAVKRADDAKGNPSPTKGMMPEKTVEDLNALYRTLTQGLKLKPSDSVGAWQLVGPDGAVCTATSIAEIARQMEAAGVRPVTTRHALGFVVAQGHVVCPRRAVAAADGSILTAVTVEMPTDRGRPLAATVVAAPEDGDVAILECAGLTAAPLPLAATVSPSSAVVAVDRTGDSWFDARPQAARGKVVTPAPPAGPRDRFVHTAVVPRGVGGGPIVDAAGRVVGMVASTPRTDASGNAAGFGIPVERIRAVLDKHPPAAERPQGSAVEDPVAAERRAIAGTVFVSAVAGRPTAAPAGQEAPR